MTYEVTEDQREAHGRAGVIKDAGERLDEITGSEMAITDWREIHRIADDVIAAARKLQDLSGY